MRRRLNIFLAITLSIILMAQGVTQAVVAAAVSLPVQHNQHMSTDQGQQGHDHTATAPNSKRDCLEYCLETVDDQFLAATSVEPLNRKHHLTDLLPIIPTPFMVRDSFDIYSHMARGPPGVRLPRRLVGLRGLVHLNGRLRN